MPAIRIINLARICLLALCIEAAGAPVRLHPQNGHYFEFRGKPVVLVGSSEHYGALVNLDFDYLRYLDEVQACGLNLVRVFSGAYRETPGAFDIEENTLSPAPGRFLAPWARSGVSGATDGGNKFDLTKWDAAWFHRLREFVGAAEQRGIVVELTFFCPFYDATLWSASPMNAVNHINGVGAGGFAACYQANSDLLVIQKALVRKCVQELQACDNVFFEIINEPYIGGTVSDAWQASIIDELVAAETGLPKRHLIAQNIANQQGLVTSPNPAVSIFNFHYALPAAALDNQNLNRVIGDDETGGPSMADFPYRREAWEFMLAGGGLMNHLDYSFTAEREDGIASPPAPGGGGPAIRRQLGTLRWFLESLPLVRCTPLTDLITGGVPSGGSAQVLGSPGEAYGIYLRGGTQANLVVNLTAGTYRGRWIDPRSGAVTADLPPFNHVGGSATLVSPAYGEDIALMLFSGDLPPPQIQLTSPVYQTVTATGSTITLAADASIENGTLSAVEFLDGDRVIGVDTVAPYSVTFSDLLPGPHVFRARALAHDGRSALSPPVKCMLAGSYQAAVNLNGQAVILSGQEWASQADALQAGMELVNASASTTSAALPLYPALDPLTRSLMGSQLVRPATTTNPALAVIYPISNGTYDVFFSLVEGESGFARDVTVMIEGNLAARGIGDIALGEWVNYGPYRTTVTDGILDLALQRETKGNPKIANFSVYQAAGPVPLENAALDIQSASGAVLVSWPANVPANRVETSTSLGADAVWQPANMAAADFTDYYEIVVPATEPRRFFRLRKD